MSKTAKRRKLYREERVCHWCGGALTFKRDEKIKHQLDLATIDHIYSRHNPHRKVSDNRFLVVLSCLFCNQARACVEGDNLRSTEAHAKFGHKFNPVYTFEKFYDSCYTTENVRRHIFPF